MQRFGDQTLKVKIRKITVDVELLLQMMLYLKHLQIEAQVDFVKGVVRHDKAVVHQQEVVAEVAIAQLQRLLLGDVLKGHEPRMATAINL